MITGMMPLLVLSTYSHDSRNDATTCPVCLHILMIPGMMPLLVLSTHSHDSRIDATACPVYTFS